MPSIVTYDSENYHVISIEKNAFKDTNLILGKFTLPSSLETISEGAFANCSGMTSIVIKSGFLSKNSFSNCTGLTTIDLHPDVVLTSSIFVNCVDVSNIIYNSSYASNFTLSPFDLINCSNYLNLTIGGSVTKLSPKLFMGLGNIRLENSSVGSNVNEISNDVFLNILMSKVDVN